MSHPEIAFIDVDGTLLNSQHRITERNLEAIHWLYARSIPVVITTGRSPNALAQALGEHMADLTKSYTSTHNGAVIHRRGSLEFEAFLPDDLSSALFQQLHAHGIHCCFHGPKSLFLCHAKAEFERMYDQHGESHMRIEHASELTESIYKVAVVGEYEAIEQAFEELGRLPEVRSGEVHLLHSGNQVADINVSHASKMHSAQHICEKLQIRPEKVFAIGDQCNDAALLGWAGHGTAMGNAPSRVKAVAKRITESHDEDGVAKAIYRTFTKASF